MQVNNEQKVCVTILEKIFLKVERMNQSMNIQYKF